MKLAIQFYLNVLILSLKELYVMSFHHFLFHKSKNLDNKHAKSLCHPSTWEKPKNGRFKRDR